jgi:uncharacterized protein
MAESVWIEYFHYALILVTGFVVGFINTLAGSGSLLTLPFLIWLGLDPLTANGTNRIAILMQGATGVAAFHRKGQFRYRHDLRYILPAVIGSIPGAMIATDLNETAMQRVIAVVMLLMLVVMVVNPQKRFAAVKHPFSGKDGAAGGCILLYRDVRWLYTGRCWDIYSGGPLVARQHGSAACQRGKGAHHHDIYHCSYTRVSDPWPGKLVYGILLGIGSVGGTLVSVRMAVKRGTPFLKGVLYAVITATAVYMLISNGG